MTTRTNAEVRQFRRTVSGDQESDAAISKTNSNPEVEFVFGSRLIISIMKVADRFYVL